MHGCATLKPFLFLVLILFMHLYSDLILYLLGQMEERVTERKVVLCLRNVKISAIRSMTVTLRVPMTLTNEERANLLRLVRVAQLLAALMIVSIFVFPLAVMTPAASKIFFPTLPPAVVWSLGIFAVVLIFAAPRVGAAVIQKGRTKSPDAAAAARVWFASVVIAMVLREATATIGLILSIVTGSLNWCFGLGIVSIIAIGRNWPRMG